ncbi:MAG: DUF401 family protein [Candidatus Moduliflexus flocculans]|nr:DUF401 family protein [Candidatus Moduliflexus flocculans]
MQSSGAFRAMVDALKNLVRDDRLILAIPSAFIGLLPMMGGAMMGAPIVDEAARRWDVSPDWKTFYNYWFRHVWEYWWPLYLSVIMASAIFRVPVWKIGLHQALYSADRHRGRAGRPLPPAAPPAAGAGRERLVEGRGACCRQPLAHRPDHRPHLRLPARHADRPGRRRRADPGHVAVRLQGPVGRRRPQLLAADGRG